MSIRNQEDMPDLTGKTVVRSEAGVDEKGYGFVMLAFSDGTVFRCEEGGQCGELWIEHSS